MYRNYRPSKASQGAAIVVLLVLLSIVIIYTLATRCRRCPAGADIGLVRRFARGATRDSYMTGYYTFPQTSSAGFSAAEDPYPLQHCSDLYPHALVPARGSGYTSNWWPYRSAQQKRAASVKEGMYRGPFDDPVEKAKYGDRRPLCVAGEEGLPFDLRNLYNGGEFGWRNSAYY